MLRRVTTPLVPLVLLFCSVSYLSAQTDMEATLRAKYEQKILMLRNFYQDDRLEFDSTGTVKGNAHPGSWTLGRVGITKVKLQPNRLELDGIRVADVYDAKASKFTSVRTPQKVRIVADRDPQQPSSLDDALSRVFLKDSERLADLVPPYWKAFFEGGVEALPQAAGPPFYRIKEAYLATASGRSSRVGKGLTAPKVISAPDPHYVPVAKSASYEGTTLLFAVITEQGTVGEVQIVRPLGYGLDDAAVETVKTWTFKAATKNGQPVAVQINVEVKFRLY